MANAEHCIVYPTIEDIDTPSFFLKVVATPVIFGIGLVGNLLTLCVLCNSVIRTSTPVFAYLTAFTCMDILRLFSIVPKYIRDASILPPEINYNYTMCHVSKLSDCIGFVTRHACIWYAAMAVTVCTSRRNNQRVVATWTKISASRLIAFILFIASSLVNFPRFFENRVAEFNGHCFEGKHLYQLTSTQVGSSVLYKVAYQWVILILTFSLPCVVLLVSNFVLRAKVMLEILRQKKQTLKFGTETVGGHFDLERTLHVLTAVFLILELPKEMLVLLDLITHEQMAAFSGLRVAQLVVEVLSLLRTALPFVIYAMCYSNFRKVFGRIFCCKADEYYEPCAYICRPCRSAAELKPAKNVDVKHKEPVLNGTSHQLDDHEKMRGSDSCCWGKSDEQADETNRSSGWI